MGVPKFASVIPYIFFGIFFTIGLINFIFPRKIWSITQGWKAIKEPPKAYFLIQRIVGLIVMLLPIVFFGVMFYLAHKN